MVHSMGYGNDNADEAMLRHIVGDVVGKTAPLSPDDCGAGDLPIDSLMLMEIIDKVQIEMGVVFIPDDYSPENFSSIKALAGLVATCRARTSKM